MPHAIPQTHSSFYLHRHLLNNLSYANCSWGLTYGFLNKNFQEINLFICHCSFITAQKTTMRLQIVRFLETFRRHRRDLSWIKTEVLFLYTFRIELLFIFSFTACHSRILQCVEFKNFCSFAVCSVLLFFHNLCPEYSWIPLEFCVCVCFQLFVYGFIFSLKKWAYLKHERVLLYSKTDRLVGSSNPSLSFFFIKKVVSCCTNVYICSAGKIGLLLSVAKKVIVCFPICLSSEKILYNLR